jgi:hypothetical protein
MSLGFSKSVVDPNLYYNIVGDECLILVLYVDDLFLTGSKSLIVECKHALASEFEMKDLGMMTRVLGLEVWQSKAVWLHKLLADLFGMRWIPLLSIE